MVWQLDKERTMVQNAYGEDEGTCEIANGSSLKVEKKKKKSALCGWKSVPFIFSGLATLTN